MKVAIVVLAALGSVLPVAAATVSDVTLAYDAEACALTVGYTLDAPAIVTLAGSLAGEPLTGEAMAALTDGGNRLTPAGTHAVVWELRKSLAERKFRIADLRVSVSAWPTNNGPDYMAVDLQNSNTVRYYPSVAALPEPIGSDRWRTTEMLFRKIPAKDVLWQRGSPDGEVGRNTSGGYERRHWVKLTCNYYLGVFECTQKQWALVYGSNLNHSQFTGGDESVWGTRPVDKVYFIESGAYNKGIRDNNWPGEDEASGHAVTTETTFVYKLRALCGLGLYLDLPTSAQWEFACRAGAGTALPCGAEIAPESVALDGIAYSFVAADPSLESIARYYMNSGAGDGVTAGAAVTTTEQGTSRVGSYAPNAWGLYDMIGNVGEWCLDFYTSYPENTQETPEVDPRGMDGSNINSKVIRGGAWDTTDLRYGLRSAATATYGTAGACGRGFRMCLTLKGE
ncbi:MAG: formylglycine-generating enzyme family protein [Kiritimatiellia bacterium]